MSTDALDAGITAATAAPVQSTKQGTDALDAGIASALGRGSGPPVAMVGPNGEMEQVPSENVASMRHRNYAVAPQPGVRPMLKSDGSKVLVTPGEADSFVRSGFTPLMTQEEDTAVRAAAAKGDWDKVKRLQGDLRELQKTAMATSSLVKQQLGTAAAGSALATAPVTVPLAVEGGLATAGAAGKAAASPAGQQVIKQGAKYVLGPAAGAIAARLGWSLGGKWVAKFLTGE